MRIEELGARLDKHVQRMKAAREQQQPPFEWYPYDILANVVHLDGLLHAENRELGTLADGLPVADIGAADGDLSFTLEDEVGWQMDIVDTAAANHNGLRGARLLKERLGSKVAIHDIDLDSQFALPRERYGLVFFLGILYHLKNPYYALEHLAGRSRHCLLSTRVARLAGSERTRVQHLPMAYLVAPTETNNDPTNFWIFTQAGLERLCERTGWTIVESMNVGNTECSDPATAEGDERAFLLLRSTRA